LKHTEHLHPTAPGKKPHPDDLPILKETRRAIAPPGGPPNPPVVYPTSGSFIQKAGSPVACDSQSSSLSAPAFPATEGLSFDRAAAWRPSSWFMPGMLGILGVCSITLLSSDRSRTRRGFEQVPTCRTSKAPQFYPFSWLKERGSPFWGSLSLYSRVSARFRLLRRRISDRIRRSSASAPPRAEAGGFSPSRRLARR
jgi:hypothetical protein